MRSLKIAMSMFVLGGVALAAKPSAAPRQVLPFVQDDYAQALATARAKKLPLFIEAWAPW